MPIAPRPVASTANTISRPIITQDVAYAARTTSSIFVIARIGTRGSTLATVSWSMGINPSDAPAVRTTSVTSREGFSARDT